MKTFVFFLGLCSVLASFDAKAAFVEGLEDIPVAEGLTQIEDKSVTFGNEESRFVEAYFTSAVLDFSSAVFFYKTTLPQMGWKLRQDVAEQLVFEREGELLEIHKESGAPLILRLTVKSKL